MKKNLTKAMAMMAAAVMAVGITACSSSSEGTTEGGDENKTTIGIVQMADNGAFTDMREDLLPR